MAKDTTTAFLYFMLIIILSIGGLIVFFIFKAIFSRGRNSSSRYCWQWFPAAYNGLPPADSTEILHVSVANTVSPQNITLQEPEIHPYSSPAPATDSNFLRTNGGPAEATFREIV